MNRLSSMCVLAGLSCMAFTALAHAKPVKSGALDICQIIDEGTTTQSNGVETCCATEKRGEYDDGMVIYGTQYCVACVAGTDECEMVEVGRSRQETIRALQKSLEGTITGN